jgi:CRP/FNR family transcriptional regulator, cyclic AMP receptor protein
MISSTDREQGSKGSELKENIQILRQITLFSWMPIETLKIIAYLCRRETFRVGELLFQSGDIGDRSFYIISGEAEAIIELPDQTVVLKTLKTEEFLCSLALLGKMTHHFSVRATEKLTCLTLEREKFLKTMLQFPEHTSKIFDATVSLIMQWEKSFLQGLDLKSLSESNRLGVSLI